MAKKDYWLMKCEPAAYSIDDLEKDKTTSWEGVRNYQARNIMRDEMKIGDGVLFYASNADPSGVSGVAKIVKEGYPDDKAWKKGHHYFDAKTDKQNPTWFQVDIGFVETFNDVVSLEELKANPALRDMMVTKRGSRLSVQPVSKQDFEIVVTMGRKK